MIRGEPRQRLSDGAGECGHELGEDVELVAGVVIPRPHQKAPPPHATDLTDHPVNIVVARVMQPHVVEADGLG